jgi:hypothetical protein
MSTETPTTPTTRLSQSLEKLTFTGPEVNEILGGISDVTRWRLEKRGLLKRVPGIHKPIYSRKSVLAMINAEAVQT